MTEKVKCTRCRGLGQIAWLGGVMRDCPTCEGDGKVVKMVGDGGIRQDHPSMQAAAVAHVVSNPVVAGVIATTVESAQASVPPIELVETHSAIGATTSLVAPIKQVDEQGREIIFPGYDNDLMEAVLAEPKMNTQDWKQKYKNVPQALSLRLQDRAAIREMYAMSKPVAPRKVDLMASQDKVAVGDPEYQKQLKKEQLKGK